MEKVINGILNKAVESGVAAGINVLVLKNGKEVVYSESGYRDLEQKRVFQRDTIMRLYSMTKPITSAAIMLLLERGKLDLQSPVSDYIDTFTNNMVNIGEERSLPKRGILIQDLMNMTSGLPYPGERTQAEKGAGILFKELDERLDTDHPMTTHEIGQQFGKLDLEFHPGEHFQYGASADVLGAIVEEVSGMRFGDFLKKEFFEPLDMVDTDFYVSMDKQERFSKVYHDKEASYIEFPTNHLGIRYSMDKQPAFESGGAGLASTLDDYSHFASMLLQKGTYHGRKILSQATVGYMTSGKLMPWQQVDLSNRRTEFQGYTYGNLMRVVEDPRLTYSLSSKGDYGWDGWLGTCFENNPVHQITILLGAQTDEGKTKKIARQIKNIIYANLL